MPCRAEDAAAVIRYLALLALAGCAGTEATVRVGDLDGAVHMPLDVAPGKVHVLLFVVADCPIANAYAPAIATLRAGLRAAPVRFFVVHVDPRIDAAAASAHAREYGLEGPIVLDHDHALVRAVGATVTPEAAVIGPGRTLLYRGRIDNWFGDLGKKRPQPTTHDLRDAITAVLAGLAVPAPRTVAVGCAIE